MENWTLQTDADGIALVLFDMPGRSVNTLTEQAIAELATVVQRIADDEAIKGAVIASGKAGVFCAGGEITDLDKRTGPPAPGEEQRVFAADFARMTADHVVFRKLETSGKPVACAIEGLALGGGAELALACHYRVASNSGAVKIGFPEVTIGLLPGGGGTQRLPRLIGIQAALKMLLDGKPVGVEEARKSGLFHALADEGAVVEAARAWVKAGGDAVQPWDKKGAKMPGGAPHAPGVSDMIAVATAASRKQFFGNYPAQENILAAVYEGTQVPFDAAQRIEARYFVKTMRSPQAKAMLRSLFVSPKAIKAGANRPAGIAQRRFNKAGVLGAGLMGAGVAYVQAAAGIETVLIDRTQEAADKGKAYSAKATAKAVSRGQMTQEQAVALLALIVPTTDYARLAGADIVVEAVFEDRAVKADVTRLAEAQLAPDAIMASNTSTLPITGLADASVRPGNFIGLHFFSPVERMGLVEIIRGEKTSDTTLAAAIDYVAAIRKLPIVVKDSRGFYTSRTITKYLEEPCEMLMEGIAPAIIENIGRMTGMPMAPLALADAIGLELPYHVRQQTKADLGDAFVPSRRGHSAGLYGDPARAVRPAQRRGLLRLFARRPRPHALARPGGPCPPRDPRRIRCRAAARSQASAAFQHGAGGGEMHRGGRHNRSARGGCRRADGVRLPVMDRRPGIADRPDRHPRVRRGVRSTRRSLRRAVQADRSAARHGGARRGFLRPSERRARLARPRGGLTLYPGELL